MAIGIDVEIALDSCDLKSTYSGTFNVLIRLSFVVRQRQLIIKPFSLMSCLLVHLNQIIICYKIQMQKNKEYLIQEIDSNLKSLNEEVLPKISEIQKHLIEFHEAEVTEFEQIVRDIEDVEDGMREKQEECESYINEINKKRKQNEKLGQISGGVLEAKSEQIKSKIKNIDAVSTGIKETVSKIKPEKLVKLPVSSEKNLNNMFNIIYKTLYGDDGSEFNWKDFRKLALEHENGEDFIFRLVNINFKDLKEEKYNDLMKLKADEAFKHISVNTKYSYDIIDLADWIDYVCLGYQFNRERHTAQKQYDKIRKDMDKRSRSSLQMSENFWKEASTQIQQYQGQLQSINSELKTVIFGLHKSIEESKKLENSTKDKISDLKQKVEIKA